MIGGRNRDLAGTVGRLEKRIAELEQELRRRSAALPTTPPGWDAGDPAAGETRDRSVSHAWLSILEPPIRRRPRLPRFPFEVLFLAGCAVAVGVADLEPLWIAAVMGAAWLLVSLTEWSATAAERRRGESTTLAPPTRVKAKPTGADQAWYLPPVEQTMAGVATPAALAESATAVTRLVKRPDLESTIEQRAPDVSDATQA